MKSLLIYINIILIIVVWAVFESVYQLGFKAEAKYIEMFYWLLWPCLTTLMMKFRPRNWWMVWIGMLCLWIVFFDVTCNLVLGHPWNYESPTSGIYYTIMYPFKQVGNGIGYGFFLVIMIIYGSFVIFRDLKV